MKLDLFQIDAFTSRTFGGNPACVVPLTEWLPENLLLKIARENAVPETAFFVQSETGFRLRWFTPDIEMDLCGHATLATAHALKSILGFKDDLILFDTKSGILKVSVSGQRYTLDFPSRMPVAATLPPALGEVFSITPDDVLKSRDYVLVYPNQKCITDIKINRNLFDQVNLDPGGVIITSPGEGCDFVSRFFTPQASILEDPVTGSAHCSLIPYWSKRLQKKELHAWQLSERRGELFCIDAGERVLISGYAITYSEGKIYVPEFS